MEKQQEKVRQKFEDGVIPIGRERVEFYMGVVYNELYRRKELKLVSRGDFGVRKVLSIVTDFLSNKVIELENNKVLIEFKEAVNDRGNKVMLPSIEVNIKKI